MKLKGSNPLPNTFLYTISQPKFLCNMIYRKKIWEEACWTRDTMNIANQATVQFIKSHL